MPKAPSPRLKTAVKASSKTAAKSKAVKKEPTLMNEILGLVLAGLGVIVLLALLSYDRRDPSLNTASARAISNWIGPVGANIASGLHQAFGWVAWIVPVVLFALAWWRIREPRLSVSALKMIGVLLLFLSLTGLLAVIDSGRPGSFHLGGWLGHFLVYGDIGLASFLSRLGAAITLGVLLIAGLLLATPLSLVTMAMQLTPREQEAGVWQTMWDRFQTWREQRAEERALRAAAEDADDDEMTIRLGDEDDRRSVAARAAGKDEKSPRKLAFTAQSPAKADGREVADDAAAKDARTSPRDATLDSLLPSGNLTLPRNGGKTTATATSPAKQSAPADDIDDFADDADEMSAERSVEEMVATAEVKRSEGADSPDDFLPETKSTLAGRTGSLIKNVLRTAKEYKLPPTDVLTPPAAQQELADTELMERAIQLAEKCKEFNVSGQVKHICPGPVVTTFEFKPDPGVKYSRVTSLVDDLCLGLKAESIRIDRIPGKSTVGIEVPNNKREVIRLREVIESKKFRESESKLTLALGKTIDGLNYIADLAKMPHLLIAGATGAGKSVALNSVLISLLYKATPDDVKLILIDPKRLELGLYQDIPHLLTPIVTDPKRASYSLRWAVSEMENRYKHLAAFGVRNIDQYNHEVCATVDRNLAEESEELPRPLPYIVIIIDELADLMMVAARDVEESITRLAQMARAVGIHLILATQRPSVDVITGLIKANFPSRISFRVSSKVDSRTIIDANGAEALLGQGDMLFLPPGTSRLVRVHGAFVDEKEVKRIADHWRLQSRPEYDEKVQLSEKELEGEDLGDLKKDEKYEEALRIVIEMGRASTSVLQRRLRIGYGRAASIIDMMYREGIVGPEDGSKPRAVLVKADFLERLQQMKEEL